MRNNEPEAFAEKHEQWAALAEAHGVSLTAVALAFASLPTAVTKLVVGTLFWILDKEAPTWALQADQLCCCCYFSFRSNEVLACHTSCMFLVFFPCFCSNSYPLASNAFLVYAPIFILSSSHVCPIIVL